MLRMSGKGWMTGAVLAALWVIVGMCGAATPDGEVARPVRIRDALLVLAGQRAEMVKLPYWLPNAPIDTVAPRAVLSFRYDAGTAPRGYALCFSGLKARARVSLNGHVLSNTLVDPALPAPRGERALVLLRVPDDYWRAGSNVIDVEVGGTGTASVSPMVVGPWPLVQAMREQRMLLKFTGPLLVAVVIGSFGLCVLLLRLRQAQAGVSGYFGFGAIAWAGHTAWNMRSTPLLPNPHDQLLWLWTFGLFVAPLVVFCVRFAERRWARLERVVMLWLALGLPLLYVTHGLGSSELASAIWRMSWIGFSALGVGAVMAYAVRRRNADSLLLSLAALAGVGFGLRDWLVAQSRVDNDPIWLTPYAGLPFVLLVAWILIDRFVGTARQLERMNVELEARVQRKSVELQVALEDMRAAKDDAEAANRAKSSFLAAASHDLRQPVHALGLYAAALHEESPTAPQRELLTRLSGSVTALDAMFGALLDISRVDAGALVPQVQAVAIEPLLHRLAAEFGAQAQAQGLRLAVRVARSLDDGSVVCDPVLTERILRNLLGNALKYTVEGGVLLSCRPRGGLARVEVWDTGIGIPPAEQERVFEEFYQVGNPQRDRSSGLGLGLSIVRRLARLLELPLSLRSVPGRGTRFTIDLRLTAEAPPRPVKLPGVSLSGLHVAVVEDDAEVRHGTRSLLARWGCQVTDAEDTAGVLAGLRHGVAPDAVVADFRLRGGETGLDAVRALRARYGVALPALIVTGDSAPERLADLHVSGLEWISKPVPPARLRSWLGAVRPAARAAAPQAQDEDQAA